MWFFKDRLFGAVRSPAWKHVRGIYIIDHPKCEICGKKGKEVHHIHPVHLYPEEELNLDNLVTLCRRHHFEWGHFFDWRSLNENIKDDIQRIKNKP